MTHVEQQKRIPHNKQGSLPSRRLGIGLVLVRLGTAAEIRHGLAVVGLFCRLLLFSLLGHDDDSIDDEK